MIFPAIDLMGGGCVRLFKGDFNQRTDYEISPLEVARNCSEAGSDWMHIVDLDGAKTGKTEQAELIMQIANESGLKVQTGGGLSELAHVERLLSGGVQRVVIGSLAITHPQMVKFWIRSLGAERIVIALDVKTGEDGRYYPATKGWTETGSKDLFAVIDDYIDSGLETILVTDISKDGVLKGADELVFYDITASVDDRTVSPQWISDISRIIDIPFCVAGGINSIEAARARLAAGADKISINSPALERPDLINELSDAFGRQCIVIGIDTFEENSTYRVKSHTGDPDKTKETGRPTLEWVEEVCERGAGEIVLNCMNWTKGETSGNTLSLETITVDCDNDTLLVRARPRGPTCHEGTTSCFGDGGPEGIGFLGYLENFLEARKTADPEKSYTASLLQGPLRRAAQKVGEEGVETALASVAETDDKLISEAADLIFHLTVLLRAKNIPLQDVINELKSRHA